MRLHAPDVATQELWAKHLRLVQALYVRICKVFAAWPSYQQALASKAWVLAPP